MSIFPDDDKRRKSDEDDLIEEARQRSGGTPTPNAPNAFEGGAIRAPGGSRGKTRNLKPNTRRPDTPRKSSGLSRGWGCILGLVIVAATVIPIFVFVIAPMTGLFNLFGEDTREVPGDPAAFDPVASFAEIEAYAKGEAASVEFIDMDVMFVRSDGTLDLTAEGYDPSVMYRFVIPAERPADAPPIGAGGSSGAYSQLVTIRAFKPGQMRSVTRTSGGSSTSYTYRHLGLDREVADPTPDDEDTFAPPSCSLATLWETAIQRDAPRDAVAVVNYEGGEYDFYISDASVFLTFNQSCELVD